MQGVDSHVRTGTIAVGLVGGAMCYIVSVASGAWPRLTRGQAPRTVVVVRQRTAGKGNDMRETRSTGRKVTVGDMIVRIGKQTYDSRIVETYGIPAGTHLSGPRGGRKVLNKEGERQGGRVLVLANGRKPVVFDDTTVVVLSDDMDF